MTVQSLPIVSITLVEHRTAFDHISVITSLPDYSGNRLAGHPFETRVPRADGREFLKKYVDASIRVELINGTTGAARLTTVGEL